MPMKRTEKPSRKNLRVVVQTDVVAEWHKQFIEWCGANKVSAKDALVGLSQFGMDLKTLGRLIIGMRETDPELYQQTIKLVTEAWRKAMLDAMGKVKP